MRGLDNGFKSEDRETPLVTCIKINKVRADWPHEEIFITCRGMPLPLDPYALHALVLVRLGFACFLEDGVKDAFGNVSQL